MTKIQIGTQAVIGTAPVLLIGANVDDKPNFMTAGACGVANREPPMISVSMAHGRHTLKGVRQNMTFSVNVPSVDLVKEADYCGIISGAKANKVAACQFNIFYGKLNNAPLIEQCPVNMECSVVHILSLGSGSLVVGRIEATHILENCLTDGEPDSTKIKPFISAPEPERKYLALGEVIATSHIIGRELQVRE
ncbi:flavin reductase family protein [Chloroflexota bacterium]